MRTADRRTQEHPPRGKARAGALPWLLRRAARRCARAAPVRRPRTGAALAAACAGGLGDLRRGVAETDATSSSITMRCWRCSSWPADGTNKALDALGVADSDNRRRAPAAKTPRCKLTWPRSTSSLRCWRGSSARSPSWGKTWAQFGRLVINAGRDPGAEPSADPGSPVDTSPRPETAGACDLAGLPVPAGLSTFPQPRSSTAVYRLTSVFPRITHRAIHRTLPWQGQGWRDRSKLSC